MQGQAQAVPDTDALIQVAVFNFLFADDHLRRGDRLAGGYLAPGELRLMRPAAPDRPGVGRLKHIRSQYPVKDNVIEDKYRAGDADDLIQSSIHIHCPGNGAADGVNRLELLGPERRLVCRIFKHQMCVSYHFSLAAGNVNSKQVPSPGCDVTASRALWASKMRRDSASPRPVPL